MTSPLYPVSTIAKLFDLTERRVQQLTKEGVIPKSSRGKYELVPTVKGYINYLKGKSGLDGESITNIASERARLIKMQADKLAMELEEEKGRLLDASEVEAAWNNIVTRCRSVLLRIPSKLALQLSVASPQEAEHIMKKAINDALLELSQTNDITGEENHEFKEDT